MTDTAEQVVETLLNALCQDELLATPDLNIPRDSDHYDEWKAAAEDIGDRAKQHILSAITTVTAGLQKENTRLVGIARAQSALVSYYENEMDRFNYDDEHLPDELLELEEGLREAEAGDKPTDPEAMESPDD